MLAIGIARQQFFTGEFLPCHNGESTMAKAKKTPAKTGWEKIGNVSQAARAAGLPVSVVMQRKHAGWTADRALSTPVKKLNRVKKAAATQAKKDQKTAPKKDPVQHLKEVVEKKDLPKVTNPLGGTGEAGSITSVPNPEPLLSPSEIEALTSKSAVRVTQTGESAVPGSITPAQAVKNFEKRIKDHEPPLVTPDKDINWIWMLAVASLIGFVVAILHEAGTL
jgi:hypothetical protein